MSEDGDSVSLITSEMLGFMVVFGADLILLAFLLWIGGAVSLGFAVTLSVLTISAFLVWIVWRWLFVDANESEEVDPVETLKERYAAGELSDEEFEAKLDRLLETDQQVHDEDLDEDDRSLERLK